jgi:hypothetical protein
MDRGCKVRVAVAIQRENKELQNKLCPSLLVGQTNYSYDKATLVYNEKYGNQLHKKEAITKTVPTLVIT